MKNGIITLAFIWFSFSSVYAQMNDTITFSINDITIDTVGDYLKLSMPNCSYSDIIGYPELPKIELRYVIPSNKIVTNVMVSDSTIQILQGFYSIIPHQPSKKIGDTATPVVQIATPSAAATKSSMGNW